MRLLRLALSLLLGPLLLVTGLICAAAAVAAHLGRSRDSFDILTHFAAIWLGLSLLVLLAGALMTTFVRWLLIAVGVVGVVAAAGLMVPEYLRDAGPAAPRGAPRPLKLIQFNVWAEQNKDIARTVDWIVAQKADVVAIEESTPAFRDLMLARTGMHLACRDCSVMIFSREKPVSSQRPRRPLNAMAPERARATFRDARGDYTVMAVHYTWPTQGSAQQAQGRVLATMLDAFPKQTLILAGDFNSTPWSFSRRREDVLFGLSRRTRALFSWPAEKEAFGIHIPIPLLPIDHVYAGAGWATVKVERGPALGSDHYPVIVTLAPREPF